MVGVLAGLGGVGGRQAEDLAPGLPHLARPHTLTPSRSAAPAQGEANWLTAASVSHPAAQMCMLRGAQLGRSPLVAEPDTAVLRTQGTQLLVRPSPALAPVGLKVSAAP